MLKRCSDKKDMTEWNEWRKNKENRHKDIELEGAPLGECYLKDVHLDLRGGDLLNEDGTFDTSRKVRSNVHLKGAHFNHANLVGARLMGANLEGAKLCFAHLEGADISEANLVGAKCKRAKVNGSTSFWECKVNRYRKNNEFTDFSGVALDDASIDPGTKQLLEYNIRRMNWEEWYKEHSRLKWLVKPFWWMSDYGLRMWRIIVTFFSLAIAFGVVYWLCPSCVIVMGEVGDIRGFWHALYFSVVTMTTLGFGDIAANPDSWGGQTLLMLQVILGYVLLGALVTRFAVLFTAGGPAGRFADEKGEKDETE